MAVECSLEIWKEVVQDCRNDQINPSLKLAGPISPYIRSSSMDCEVAGSSKGGSALLPQSTLPTHPHVPLSHTGITALALRWHIVLDFIAVDPVCQS
jgi:hypothetical protein